MGIEMMTLAVFVSGSSLVLMLALLLGARNRRVADRIQDLTEKKRPGVAGPPASVGSLTHSVLPKIGAAILPNSADERTRLTTRLLHAGFYRPSALLIFLGAKCIVMAIFFFIAFAVGMVEKFPFLQSLLFGILGCGLGMFAPNFWLDRQKTKRQTKLRRGLPDALDMIVICLKGGLSLQGAFQRVVSELWMVHPMLAGEFAINLRESQLGRSTGEAMKHFADRCDLEEIRGLASVVLQAERLGASTTNALRIHADTLRLKRLQRAEEMAGKAGTKMVFPTILCIFPAILLVVIGPAAIQIKDLFANMSSQ